MTARDLAQFLPDFSMIRAATVYRARCGMRRAFLSASDALAYERGYATFPAMPDDHVHTPAMRGFWDRERELQERDDQRADEQRERDEVGA